VPPCVRYEMAFLLIKDVVGCESRVQEGLKSRENLSTASGDPSHGKTVAKHD
jgi:hypothetical protein